MKILLSTVFVLFLRAVTSENVKSDIPNTDIITVLKHILARLDTIEGEVKANRDETKEVQKQVQANREETKDIRKLVKANQEGLLKLDAHVRDQQEKVKEVKQEIQVEKQHIAANTNSLKEVTLRNVQLSELIAVNLQNISKDINEVKEVLTDVLPGKSEARPAQSCSWIRKRSYCVRSGDFWIKDGGKPTSQFCDMDDDEQVTTTVVPTTRPMTKRPTTTQKSTRRGTTETPTTQPLTTVPIHRPGSCKELKSHHPHLKSGTYDITAGGSTFQVFCDMDTDGGGWIMVGRAVVAKDSEAKEVDLHKIRQDDYTKLQAATSGRFLLSTQGLNSLYNVQHFTEVRFDCSKPYHGRRVNLKTKGTEIVQWLLMRRSCYPHPPSCGTFTSLHGDTSFLGGDCRRWWQGKWNWCKGLYHNPMAADDEKYAHYVSLNYDQWKGLWCDDHKSHPQFNNIGSWAYYVR